MTIYSFRTFMREVRVKYDPSSITTHLRGDWGKFRVRHGISTVRSTPSQYLRSLRCFGQISSSYWRDVADRTSMTTRLDAFCSKREIDFDADILSDAVKIVSDKFGFDNLKPLRLREAVNQLPGSSSAGYPYQKKRSACRTEIVHDASVVKDTLLRGKKPLVYPCVASARRVVRERGKNKPRLVWCYPGAISALEATFEGASKHKLKELEFLGCNTNWMSRDSWIKLFDVQWESIISLDYQGFDASVPAFLIHKAFKIYKQWFELTEQEDRLLVFLRDYFVHTPIVFYDKVIQKHRGIPSGSCFTYIIGTLVNLIASNYLALSCGFTISSDRSRWSGDDSRMVTTWGEGPVSIPTLSEVCGHLGLTINLTKSDVRLSNSIFTDDGPDMGIGSFLSRELNRGYPNLRFDREKALAQLIIPEKPDKSVHDLADRIIGLTYAYGFDKQTYDCLAEAWQIVKNSYRGSLDIGGERIRNKMRWILNSEEELDWSFKSWEFYHQLYFDYV
uniref:RdRp n=1 Tax=viral metagenome TaxID=1070528 RepID=A0A2V0RLH6_9ZZZZ